MMRMFLLIPFLSLAACTSFPEVDASLNALPDSGTYPRLLPTEALGLDQANRAEPAGQSLEARAARLRARAAALRAS